MPKSRSLKNSMGGGRPSNERASLSYPKPKADPLAGAKPGNLNARKLMKKVEK